jgi:hypothetical protein
MPKGRAANRIDMGNAIAQFARDKADRNAIETGVVKFYDTTRRFGNHPLTILKRGRP